MTVKSIAEQKQNVIKQKLQWNTRESFWSWSFQKQSLWYWNFLFVQFTAYKSLNYFLQQSLILEEPNDVPQYFGKNKKGRMRKLSNRFRNPFSFISMVNPTFSFLLSKACNSWNHISEVNNVMRYHFFCSHFLFNLKFIE